MKQAFAAISTPMQAQSRSGNLSVWFAGIGFLFLGAYLIVHGMYRFFVAFLILNTILMLWRANRTAALAFMLAFLMALGDVRRIANLFFNSSTLDPLLLLSSLFCIYLVVPILLRLRFADGLSKLVVALMALMSLEIFNPRQGSLLIGFSGAMFFLIPLCWYWVGRKYATAQMVHTLLFKVFVPFSLIDALFGLYQTLDGPLPWQVAWVSQFKSGYTYSAGHYREFGFSTSVPEFAATLLIGATLILAAIFAKKRTYWLLLPIVGSSLVLTGARGYIVRILLSGAVIWAVMGRSSKAWIPRFAFALVLGVGLAFYSASHSTASAVDVNGKANSTIQQATAHTAQGIADPTHSTAQDHKTMVVGGFTAGFKNPIGFGLGYTTLANAKFGGSGYSSETDVTDLFMATGFIGGFLYIGVIMLTVQRLATYCRKNRGVLSLALCGILAAMLGGWFGEGQYAMGFLFYFCIGFVSREAQPQAVVPVQRVPAPQMNAFSAAT